jgi:hypothetical protein
MDRIPVELINRILLFHFDTTPDDLFCGNNRLAPSQVSRLWREVAILDPGCWSKLDFKVYFEIEGETRVNPTFLVSIGVVPADHLLRIGLQLNRAQSRLIDFSISLCFRCQRRRPATCRSRIGSKQSDDKSTMDLKTLIFSNAHKFRSYAESGTILFSPEILSYFSPSIVESLKVAKLNYNDDPLTSYHLPALHTLNTNSLTPQGLSTILCPRLRSLEFIGLYRWDQPDLKIQSILSSFPELEELTGSINIILDTSDIQHSKLKRLKLHGRSPWDDHGLDSGLANMSTILRFMGSFPNMTSLTLICLSAGCEGIPEPELLEIAKAIEELCFEDCVPGYHTKEATYGLSLFTHVTRLCIGRVKQTLHHDWLARSPIDIEVFLQFILDSKGDLGEIPSRWPLLRFIEIHELPVTGKEMRLLLLVLKNRNRVGDVPLYLSMFGCKLAEPSYLGQSLHSIAIRSWR